MVPLVGLAVCAGLYCFLVILTYLLSSWDWCAFEGAFPLLILLSDNLTSSLENRLSSTYLCPLYS